MSVLSGFEMLNKSLRRVKEDRRRHEETMANAELKQAAMEYEMNNPVKQLQRAQAAEKMKIVEFDTEFSKRKGMTMEKYKNFESLVRPAVESVIPPEYELDADSNQLVFKGTRTRAKMAKWQADQLKADIETASTLAVLDNNKLDTEISGLQDTIAKAEREYAKDNKFGQLQLNKQRTRLAQMIADRDNPKNRVKRLMSENSQLSKTYREILKNPNVNPKLLTRIEGLMKINNDELELHMATGNAKNMVAVPYHITKGGKTISRNIYAHKTMVGGMPTTMQFGDGVYTRGTVKKDPAGTPGSGLTVPQQNTINKDYTAAKAKLAAAKGEVDQISFVQSMIADGETSKDTAIDMFKNIQANKEMFVNDFQALVDNYESRFGDRSWFVTKSKKANVDKGSRPELKFDD